jgi:hypothetical protein
MEKIAIQLKEKVAVLQIKDFDTDIDTDELLKIQYHNLMAEVLTFPVLMNRIGNLKSEIEEIYAETKLESEIKIAQLEEFYRRKLISGDSQKQKTPTIAEVDSAVKQDPVYSNLKKRLIRIQREMATIDSLYWAAKSKDDKLNKLSDKLRPSEFEGEIVEEVINGILIKIRRSIV